MVWKMHEIVIKTTVLTMLDVVCVYLSLVVSLVR